MGKSEPIVRVACDQCDSELSMYGTLKSLPAELLTELRFQWVRHKWEKHARDVDIMAAPLEERSYP